MGNTTTKKRIGYFDVLRGIGILLMILGHVPLGDVFGKYIHAFHMPLFFFVSGYFFNPVKYKNFWVYIRHLLKTLILPYTVFVLFCQPLHYLYTKEFSLRYFLLSYFTSNHNRIDVAGAYWFLLCLFTAQILYYLIDRYVKNAGVKCAVVIVLTLVGNFLPIDLPLCMDSALSMLVLLYLGQFVRKNETNKILLKLQNVPLWLLALLFLLNFGLIMLNGAVNIRTNRYENVVLFWLGCLSAVLCYLNLAKIIDRWQHKLLRPIGSALRYIGANSIVYLTTNEIVLYLVTVVLTMLLRPIGITVDVTTQYITKFVVAAVAVASISAIVWVVNKTKLKVLFGK